MSKLLGTLKQNKITKNKVVDITGLSIPTVRKYLKNPDLFSVGDGKIIIKHLKNITILVYLHYKMIDLKIMMKFKLLKNI